MDWNSTVDQLHELEHRHWRAHLHADYQGQGPLAAKNLPLALCERDHEILHSAIVATKAGLMKMGIEIQRAALGKPDQWLVDALEEIMPEHQGWRFDGRHWSARCMPLTLAGSDNVDTRRED